MTRKIRMTQTREGSPDGIQLFTYEVGKSYDLPLSLAHIFLQEGWAMEDKAMDAPMEVKANGLEVDHASCSGSSDTHTGEKPRKGRPKRR